VHSLIALAFLGKRPQGYDVMHIDGTRTNNKLNNLKYGTRSENMLHAAAQRRVGSARIVSDHIDHVRARHYYRTTAIKYNKKNHRKTRGAA
jgi:hypothetical protein